MPGPTRLWYFPSLSIIALSYCFMIIKKDEIAIATPRDIDIW